MCVCQLGTFFPIDYIRSRTGPHHQHHHHHIGFNRYLCKQSSKPEGTGTGQSNWAKKINATNRTLVYMCVCVDMWINIFPFTRLGRNNIVNVITGISTPSYLAIYYDDVNNISYLLPCSLAS